MKITKKRFTVLFTSIYFLTALWCEEIAEIPSDYSKFYVLKYNQNAVGNDLECPVNGTIIKEQESNDKMTIVLSCLHEYFWKGNAKKCNYEIIIYNIQSYQRIEDVKQGNVLGKIAKDTVLLGRCKDADPYLVLGSSYPTLKYGNLYYYQPGWLIQTTDTLSYRQVESFENSVLDYFSRWKKESHDEDKRINYNSLFYYPELDSIRFKIKLKKFPEELKSYGTIGITSQAYLGRNIWETFTLLESKCEYKPVLCWQYHFRKYLEAEYKPGSDLYIYGTFLALDSMEKRIIFNVRDFLIISEEEQYENRLKDIKDIE